MHPKEFLCSRFSSLDWLPCISSAMERICFMTMRVFALMNRQLLSLLKTLKWHTIPLHWAPWYMKKNHTINTYPKIQESYETTYTYPTFKIQNLCNINTSMFYLSKKFSKTKPPCMHFTTYPCNTGIHLICTSSYWCNPWSGEKQMMDSSGISCFRVTLTNFLSHVLALKSSLGATQQLQTKSRVKGIWEWKENLGGNS